jgi:signal peptidase II
MIIFLIIIIFFIISDRFLKFLSINHYFDRPINIFKNIFTLNFIENYNIAFSLPLKGIFLNIVIILIIFFLIRYLSSSFSKKETRSAIFLSAIILGALSNLADRLKYGFVIDYLDLKYFTVFNLADAMIVGGMAGLLWIAAKRKKTA